MPSPILSKAQKLIEGYLIEQGFSRVESGISDQLLVRGKIVTNDIVFDTVIDIDQHVPVSYPKFYTVNNGMVFNQPHIERPFKIKGIGTLTGMCIISENEKMLYTNPKELIHMLLNKYEDLCYELSNDTFDKESEFMNEFNSYWPRDKIDIHTYFEEEIVSKSMMPLILLKSSNNIYQAIIYDNFNSINKYIKASNHNVIKKSICPYIDIGNNFSLPFPSTYKDLKDLFIKSGHSKFLKRLQTRSNIWEILIVGINLPKGEKHYVAVNLLNFQDKQLIKNKNKFQVFFSKKYEKSLFQGFHIKSIKKEWLMKRGGNNNTEQIADNSFKIAILGCGSIGSNLAYKLCKNGISNITLIDPDNLKNSNIGRHFLGMNNIGENKAKAMQNLLQSQFVDININAYDKKAQDCLEKISDVDLIIGAIGSDEPSVEPHIAELIKQSKMPPMLSCWLEANGVVGHGFYVDETIDSYMFDKMTDAINIIEHKTASELIQSEVGCNSEYMPYSQLNADIHIIKITKFVLDILLKNNTYRALSSYGNLELFSKNLNYKAEVETVKYWENDEVSI